MGKRGYCDGHGEVRNDVVAVGRDSNQEPDAPDFCFLCRKEAERHRFYDRKQGRYVSEGFSWAEVRAEAKVQVEDQHGQAGARPLKRQVRAIVAYLSEGHISAKLQREMVDDLWGIFR